MASSAIPHNLNRVPVSGRSWKLLRWVVPTAIALLLVASTFVLLTLSSTKERSEAQEQVISDTLLARESIKFQLGREMEALQRLAADIGRGLLEHDAVDARLKLFLRRAGQMEGVALVDDGLHPIVQAQRVNTGGDILTQLPSGKAQASIARAHATGQPVFSGAFQAHGGAVLALVVPVPESGPANRFLIGIYSLDRLLEEMVPWNLAQDYEFTLSDIAGTVHARRASAAVGRGVYTNQEPLELGELTLLLGANSIKGPPDWIANALRGGIAALVGVLLWSLWALWRDHTRRVAAEQRVLEEAAFRQAMGDCAVIGLSARDMDGRVTYVNPAFCEMVGVREDELVGHANPNLYWVPEADDDYRRRLDDVLEGRSKKMAYETELLRRNGEPFPAAIYDAPLLNADGRQVGWTSSIVDLTEQKDAAERDRLQQERLQTAARLTTMGELASSLAHELNQPLGAIASYLAGSLNMLEHGDVERDALIAVLAKASAQTQRAGQVIRRVHEFVRKQEPRYVSVNLTTMLEDCRPLIELQARRDGVQVQASVDPGLPRVRGDPVMLQQVILNLTRNAIDAMAQSLPERRQLVIAIGADEGGVRFSIRDFGCGIPKEESERVFSPFFTTKPEGMGMGLAICRTIVQAHSGRLWLERLDQGTVFHLWLAAVA